jgi:hypothetical protein
MASSSAMAESVNDEPFSAFQDKQLFVEKDSMYRLGNSVVFRYRVDIVSSLHPWSSLTRTVRTQCDANNFINISAIIVFKDPEILPLEIKGDETHFEYEPKSYREQMTRYVCESAPH